MPHVGVEPGTQSLGGDAWQVAAVIEGGAHHVAEHGNADGVDAVVAHRGFGTGEGGVALAVLDQAKVFDLVQGAGIEIVVDAVLEHAQVKQPVALRLAQVQVGVEADFVVQIPLAATAGAEQAALVGVGG